MQSKDPEDLSRAMPHQGVVFEKLGADSYHLSSSSSAFTLVVPPETESFRSQALYPFLVILYAAS